MARNGRTKDIYKGTFVCIQTLHLNFALRNSKRRLKIECLRYFLKFGYQNCLMLCSCVKLLGKIQDNHFSNGFSSSWTAATCFSMLFLIKNWKSLILLKVWLPEWFDVVLMCETFGQDMRHWNFEFLFKFCFKQWSTWISNSINFSNLQLLSTTNKIWTWTWTWKRVNLNNIQLLSTKLEFEVLSLERGSTDSIIWELFARKSAECLNLRN